MRVVAHRTFGGPEVLYEDDIPAPTLGPEDVRVRVSAAAVNPTDAMRRSGLLAELLESETKPWVPGMDFAGVVAEIGESVVTDLVLGDRVMGVLFPEGTQGAYAEEVVVSAESVVRAPANVSDLIAASVPMTGLTAMMTLDRLGLNRGDVLGVTGAAGVYGGYVIQLAKAAGLRVIADASDQDRERVLGLGADIVVQRGDDVATRFRQAFPDGLSGVADGALLNEKVVPAIRRGGALVSLRFYRDDTRDDIVYHPIHIRDYLFERTKLDALRGFVERGILTPSVAAVYPTTAAAAAHQALDASGNRGRLVLTFGVGWLRMLEPIQRNSK